MTTGLIYSDFFLKHDDPFHPETANRLNAIMRMLRQTGLISRLTVIAPQAVTEDIILSGHSPEHLKSVQALSHRAEKIGLSHFGDTYANEFTYRSALLSAGGIVLLCDRIMQGALRNGFALGRPPGHHATANEYMGFCFFSNAALAALYLLNVHGLHRVAIVDFDVHQGNGTEAICRDNPDILFISTHQKNIYPMTSNEPRRNDGQGGNTVINCPLPAGYTDQDYAELTEEVLLPALAAFAPEFVIVSAGYDAHRDDPLASLELTADGFGRISRRLVTFAEEQAQGRIAFTLEGGYHLEALSASVEMSIRALLNGETGERDPMPEHALGSENRHLIDTFKQVYGIERRNSGTANT